MDTLSTKDNLRRRAEIVRDETKDLANTSERVGQLLIDIVDSSTLEIIESTEPVEKATEKNLFSALASLFHFLRKDAPDTAAELLKFLKGAELGDFASGMLTGTGAKIWPNGHAEFMSMLLRGWLEVPEIRYNRVQVVGGELWVTDGAKFDTITPNGEFYNVKIKLEEGELITFWVGDILKGVYHDKSIDGKFKGFRTLQFRVTAVDQGTQTITVAPRYAEAKYKPVQFLEVARTGSFTEKSRQRSILIDSKENCITFLDHVNAWDITPNMEVCWFGRKDRNIPGVPSTAGYNAKLSNIIMSGKIFQYDDISGNDYLVPIDKGTYVKEQRYAYYDRVSAPGGLWLCVNESGTTSEPVAGNPDWLLQVSDGTSLTPAGNWNSGTTYSKGQIVYLNGDSFVYISATPSSGVRPDRNPGGYLTTDGKYLTTGGKRLYTGDPNHPWQLLAEAGKDGFSIIVQYSADKINWHDVFNPVSDKYMRQLQQDGKWTDAMQIVGETGKGTDFQFSVNSSLTDPPTSGWQDAPPVVGTGQYLWMRSGTVTPPATEPPSWTAVRIGGETGKDGQGIQVQYSANAVDWHNPPFVKGSDIFMHQQLGNGSWSEAMRIVGETGKNGPWTDFQFAVNNSLTNPPTSGWQDAPPAVGTGQYLWMRSGIVTPPATEPDSWTAVRIGGEVGKDGQGIQAQYSANAINWHNPPFTAGDIFMRQQLGNGSWSDPMRIVGETGKDGPWTDFQFAVNSSLTNSPTSGWQDAPPEVGAGQYLWMRSGIVTPPATEPVSWTAVRIGGTGIRYITEPYSPNTAYKVGDVVAFNSGKIYCKKDNIGMIPVPFLSSGGKLLKTGNFYLLYKPLSVGTINSEYWDIFVAPPVKEEVEQTFTTYFVGTPNVTPPTPILTGNSLGWSTVVPSKFNWVSQKRAISIAAGSWSQPVKMTAIDGDNGLNATTRWLTSTTSVIRFNSLGSPVPSSFVVSCKKQTGILSVEACTDLYLVYRVYSDATYVSQSTPTKVSSVTIANLRADGIYYIRGYEKQSDAQVWNGNFTTEFTVTHANDGQNGAKGLTGASPRMRGLWNGSTSDYLWNNQWRDIVIVNVNGINIQYTAKLEGVIPANINPSSGAGVTYWEQAQQFKFIATDLLLADKIKADMIDTDNLISKKIRTSTSGNRIEIFPDGNTAMMKGLDLNNKLVLEVGFFSDSLGVDPVVNITTYDSSGNISANSRIYAGSATFARRGTDGLLYSLNVRQSINSNKMTISGLLPSALEASYMEMYAAADGTVKMKI